MKALAILTLLASIFAAAPASAMNYATECDSLPFAERVQCDLKHSG